MKGEVPRTGTGRDSCVCRCDVMQRALRCVESLEHDHLHPEICGEGITIRSLAHDAMRVRRLLSLRVRPFPAMLLDVRRRSDGTVRLDRQNGNAAAGVVGNEQ